MKIYNFTLLWVISTSIIMAFSSSSMFYLWVALEINMMSFVPFMNAKDSISINSMVMYFIIQAFASSMFIFLTTMLLLNSNFLTTKISLVILITMLIKIGAAPFHVWFPQISEGIPWFALFMLSTIQKIIPLHIVTMLMNNYIYLPIIMSAMIGSFGGFNQISLRKILAFSSISHLAWMMSLIYSNSNMWLIYMAIYSLIMIFMTQIFLQFNINTFSQMILYNEQPLYFITLMFSLGGLPPTMGFFMKWMTLKIMVFKNVMLIVPLILSSLINLYFYSRLAFPFFLKNLNSNKWNSKIINKMFYFFSTNLIVIFLLIPFL
uniref:NADH dehydrogenase subunit 2 n=1 Tax=Ornithodoros furcosus TaxID=2928876 RepID=UPI00223756A1|nr:NADH dehydrogenase subunit 2 [Ornithodoros furcosus]UYB78314.1 NADH dehydrogenase subunit 2 [Ornithodoros furcosus]UYB78327.1 NADH dehydrogenase subunit 2 [Ornithodoros furcosus]